MCVAILDAAGLEPGFRLASGTREPSARRKIVGDTAKPPPYVLDAAELAPGKDATRDVVAVIGTAAPIAARLLVCDATSPHARPLADAAEQSVTFYGLDGEPSDVTPGWLAAPVPFDPESGAQPFDLYAGGSSCGRFALRIAGKDAVRSAVAAIAACAEGFGVHIEKARQSLASFEEPHG
jgi:UDP-N-acetylmuramate-alanine ligase